MKSEWKLSLRTGGDYEEIFWEIYYKRYCHWQNFFPFQRGENGSKKKYSGRKFGVETL